MFISETAPNGATISRGHNFENRLNLVVQGRKYYYLSHEKDINYLKVARTKELDAAFKDHNWEMFTVAEAAAL